MNYKHPNKNKHIYRSIYFKGKNLPVTRFLFICPPRDPSSCTTLTLISSKDSASF